MHILVGGNIKVNFEWSPVGCRSLIIVFVLSVATSCISDRYLLAGLYFSTLTHYLTTRPQMLELNARALKIYRVTDTFGLISNLALGGFAKKRKNPKIRVYYGSGWVGTGLTRI